MKPEFALSLTHEGIRLLQRSDEGWLAVGTVALADTGAEGALDKLHAKATRFAAETPFHSKVILPNSEILYLDVDVGGATGPDYEASIREALDGRTPYALDELAYDYVVSGKTAQIAVVARETLKEAEAFATRHGFNPVSFAAIPPKDVFVGEPMFGTTEAAETLLPEGTTLDRDAVPIVVVGQALAPRTPKETASAPETPVDTPKPSATADAEEKRTAAQPEPSAEAPTRRVPPVPETPAETSQTAPEAATATDTGTERPSFTSSRKGARATRRAVATPEPRLDLHPVVSDAAPRAKPRLGLVVTLVLLAGLVLAGVYAGLTRPSQTEPPPELSRTPEAAPAEQSAADLPVFQTEDADIADVAPETEADPVEASEVAANDAAPLVMPEMSSGLEAPRPDRITPFDAAPSPEEVAEGEEASAPETVAVFDPEPLPSAPESLAPAPDAGTGPSLLETETVYAVTGIWQRSPEQLPQQRAGDLRDLYVASLDAEVEIDDALALPSYEDGRDALFDTPQPPIGPGQFFDLDEDGRVVATPEGTLSPDGVLVYAGAGATRPLQRPFNALPDTDLEALAAFRPAPRPENLSELRERALLDGRTREELAVLTPRARPASLQEEALAAAGDVASALAVARAPSPAPRPSTIDRIVAEVRSARARTESASATGAAAASLAQVTPPRAAAPAIPTQASVARQATLENVLRMDRMNLIGVYGTESDRRALIRTPTGRYVKVQVGDRFNGGRVAVIGESSMQYSKGGQNITLKLPNS